MRFASDKLEEGASFFSGRTFYHTHQRVPYGGVRLWFQDKTHTGANRISKRKHTQRRQPAGRNEKHTRPSSPPPPPPSLEPGPRNCWCRNRLHKQKRKKEHGTTARADTHAEERHATHKTEQHKTNNIIHVHGILEPKRKETKQKLSERQTTSTPTGMPAQPPATQHNTEIYTYIYRISYMLTCICS